MLVPGLTIGRGVIVGWGSVATQNIPDVLLAGAVHAFAMTSRRVSPPASVTGR
jgi:acetyltransferase-like isoleucine patch superfamily enzyme